MVKVNQGSSYENIGSTQVPDAVYQVSRSSASWFRRRFLKFFTIYGHGYLNIWTNFHSSHPMEGKQGNEATNVASRVGMDALKFIKYANYGMRAFWIIWFG